MLTGVKPMDANEATKPTEEANRADTQAGTPCKMCRERGKNWAGSNPICSFPNGEPFTSEGWNCATANAIRDIAEATRDGVVRDHCGDQSSALIRIDNDYPVGYDAITDAHCLFVTWYKRRGRTGGMWLLGCEDDPAPRPPTEAEALAIIEHYKAE
jgi:hypothetical protein